MENGKQSELNEDQKELIRKYDVMVLTRVLGDSSLKEALLSDLEKLLRNGTPSSEKRVTLTGEYVTFEALEDYAKRIGTRSGTAMTCHRVLDNYFRRKKNLSHKDKATTYGDVRGLIEKGRHVRGFGAKGFEFMRGFLEYSGV